jgi:chromosome partitioning protein
MIITFANQKGGVGKTTLCMLFANYLSKRGDNVLVMDLDRQRSILSKRKADAAAFTDQEEVYNVEECDIENIELAQKMMDAAKKIDGYVLLDTPGNVTEDGLIPVFKDSDVIICPYKYEKLCLESTGVFIQVLLKLKEEYKTMNPKMFYVPNNIDTRIGTKEEVELWKETDDVFRKLGYVTPLVAYKSSLMRTNTYSLTTQQEVEVQQCFDYIISQML